MEEKIGTHNSCTSERSKTWLHALLTPFARCQSKTIAEQYNAGCRYFDLRVDKDMRICHGIWKSALTLSDVLAQLRALCRETVYIMITYEGSLNVVEEALFIEQVFDLMDMSIFNQHRVVLTAINIKKPIWRTVWCSVNAPQTVSKFKNLDGSTWHTYLPIPWLWKRLYYNEPVWDLECYTMVDFL